MRNILRTYTAGLLVTLMTINPAWACRNCGGGNWGGVYYSNGPVYYAPTYYQGCCGGWSGCCGGYEVVVDECSSCQPSNGCSSCGTASTQIAPTESTHPTMQSAPTEQPQPTMAAPAMPAAPQQPAKVERPVDVTPMPALPQTPAAAQPQVPLPDTESVPATTPAQPAAPTDNLFNSPPTPPPAEKPAVEAPVPAPVAKPAASDDLFGTPAEKPAAPAPAPAEKPATEAPMTPPAAAPEKPAASDDLFGTPATPAPAPAEKPADKPADKPAGEEKKDEKKSDDIFGTSINVLREAGGLASDEMRTWVDNTGSFKCQARLVRFSDGQVRLLKDNGHTTTVALGRLSANDLRFVERQASAQQANVFQTAQSMIVIPGMAN